MRVPSALIAATAALGIAGVSSCRDTQDFPAPVSAAKNPASPVMVVPGEDVEAGFIGFGRPVGIVADSSGVAYVADAFNRKIYTFDSAGNHARTFGREGSGPGEFRAPAAIGLYHDSLIVLDNRSGKATWFSLEGVPLKSEPWPAISGSALDVRVFPAQSGYYLRSTTPTDGGGLTPIFERRSAAGLDTIFPPQAAPPGWWCEEEGGGVGFLTDPTGVETLFTPSYEGGLAVARSNEFEIAITDTSGVPVETYVLPSYAYPLTAAQRDSVRAKIRRFRRSWSGGTCTYSGVRGADTWPALQYLFYSHEGDLIVLSRVPDGMLAHVLRSGQRVASLSIPGQLYEAAPYARDGRILLFLSDSMGVPTLNVFRYGG